MMIGKVKGYSVCEITKGTLKKDEFFEEIESKDRTIKAKMQNVLQNKGLIFGLKKDKKLKAVYLFESANEDKKRILKFTEKILLDEINKEIQDEFEKDLTTAFLELVSLGDYTKVEWNDNVIVPKTVKVGKYNIPLGSLIFFIGVIFGILTNDLTMGICIGICIGICLGGRAAVTMKRKDDNSKN